MGIEPTRPAWKAGILPLNYTRTIGIRLQLSYQRLYMIPHFKGFVNTFLEKICDFEYDPFDQS